MKGLLLLLGLAGGAWSFLQGDAPESPASMEAICVSYWATGGRRTSLCCREGVPDGPASEWHRNGRLAAQGRYAAGLRQGQWSFWSPDGALDAGRSGLYRAGRRLR